MHFIAIRGNFEFKVDRSNADFYVLSCIVDGCTWMVHASMISGRDIWVIRKYVSLHTCPRDVVSKEHRQASSQFVGELLKHDFRDVMALMCGKHGVEISSHVGRKAQSFALEAIRGSAEQSYSDIPSLCAVLKDKNPSKCLVDFM